MEEEAKYFQLDELVKLIDQMKRRKKLELNELSKNSTTSKVSDVAFLFVEIPTETSNTTNLSEIVRYRGKKIYIEDFEPTELRETDNEIMSTFTFKDVQSFNILKHLIDDCGFTIVNSVANCTENKLYINFCLLQSS